MFAGKMTKENEHKARIVAQLVRSRKTEYISGPEKVLAEQLKQAMSLISFRGFDCFLRLPSFVCTLLGHTHSYSPKEFMTVDQ